MLSDNPDLAVFEGKMKEKCFELQIKRNTLAEIRSKLHEGLLERHQLERSLEKVSRECEETKIQLDVAIQAARRGESERASSREILARQSVQLEATIKDRNFLQDQVRKLQLESGELQGQLDQIEEKVKSHHHLQEACKIKEDQWRIYFDSLQRQVKELEQAHAKLKTIINSVLIISGKAIFQISYEKNNAKELLVEKQKLYEQVLSLSGELEFLREDSAKNNVQENYCNTTYLQECKRTMQEMENKLQENEKETILIQNSLSNALVTISQFQKSADLKDEKIKLLENELAEIKSKKMQNLDKAVQYDQE